MPFELIQGDCLEVLRNLPTSSVDSIVTDPPYGLTNNGGGPGGRGLDTPFARAKAGAHSGGFMGLKWDSDVPPAEVLAECLRVLKPGGYLLAFAGTRTQHRMATRVEDAGFEIRDMIAWVYGSGFPKSHNGDWGGTALKPALEPITMARKPLEGTVARNWAVYGTGALNIDVCRVPLDARTDTSQLRTMQRSQRSGGDGWGMSTVAGDAPQVVRADGRWPANLIHDGSDEVLQAFPYATGQKAQVTGAEPSSTLRSVYEGQAGDRAPMAPRADAGSAARFFYCAKASRADRNAGLPSSNQPAVRAGATMRAREDAEWEARNGNHHPTVKPTDLMAYLVRLVTPRGGLVLDPFMGSGSTGKACIREGLRFIGIEREPEYLAIARNRIEHEAAQAGTEATQQRDLFLVA